MVFPFKMETSHAGDLSGFSSERPFRRAHHAAPPLPAPALSRRTNLPEAPSRDPLCGSFRTMRRSLPATCKRSTLPD
jgi:hypothetical protein